MSNTIKQKIFNREVISYLIFGILTTLVDFAIYFLCYQIMGIHYLTSNVIAWCGAVLFAYITNKIFVFQSKSFRLKLLLDEVLSFIGARIFSLVFSVIMIYAFVFLMGFPAMIAKIISSVFVVIINYVFSKMFIFHTNDSKNEGILAKIEENFCYIASFIIPLGILIFLYYSRGIYPFGEKMYLRSDCYHQYAPFHMELYDKLMHGESLTYSWDIGLGMNFSALYSYYLASPVNWLIGMVSKNHIIEYMNVLIVVKTALCSLTFNHYICKHFNTKKFSACAFGICYALSSYFAAFSWNLMWLDCLVLLPLIMLGLERLVKSRKCYLYCISLGFAILSNYYIGIMLCIYSVLYFFALLYSDDSKKNFSYYVQRIKSFALYSLLAGGFAAVSIMPAYAALSSTASGDFNFPTTVVNYFSVFDMISRSLINVDPAIFSAHDPNLFCTIAIFILIPLYFVNPKIKTNEKIAKGALLGIFLVSFNTNIPNYIWHGFHYPNSLPCRESFIYIFLILTMAYEALYYIKETTTKQIASSFAGALALFLAIEKLMVSDSYSAMIIYLSVTFLIFYTFVIVLLKSNNYRQSIISYLLIIVVISEAYVNLDKTSLSTSDRDYYVRDNKAIETVLNIAKEQDEDLFYRVEKYDRKTKNDGAWIGYHSASTFSSTANAGVSEFYGAVGLEESTNALAYYGHTPLTESLLSVKYVLSNTKREDTSNAQLFAESSSIYLYKNTHTLPIGFMLPGNLEEEWDLTDSNPFEVQNSFARLVLNDNTRTMYHRLYVESDNSVNLQEETSFFIYVTTSLDKITVECHMPDGTTTSKSFSSMTHKHILDLGTYPEGTVISVKSADKEVESIQFYAYSYDDSVFVDVYNQLSQNSIQLSEFSDTSLSGTVTAAADGLFFTSIPYDKGWTVIVDGKKVSSKAFKDAFVSFELSAGTHEISFSYTPAGLNIGIVLSVFSALIFIMLMIVDIKSRKHKQQALEASKVSTTTNPEETVVIEQS